jgi:hypothetical protein
MTIRISAGELSAKAQKDKTDYNALELGHAITDDILQELQECREIYNKIFDEEEYCIVRVIADDCLINTLTRYKYYGWLYLPSPRPNQTVFLYNKSLDVFTHRLWSLPSAARMAQLATNDCIVPKSYEKMQAWSVAFFKGTFWEYIRHEHKINMLSEHEFFLAHREELIQAGCKEPNSGYTEAFDFSKVQIEKIIDTQAAVIKE